MEDFVYFKVDYDTTLVELTTDPLSIFNGFKNNTAELLAYEDDQDISNFERIVEMYSKAELISEAIKIDSLQITIVKAGTVLAIPKSAIEINILTLTGRKLFIKDIKSFSAFYGTYLKLLQQEGFTLQNKPSRNTSIYDDIDIREYQISVWIWSRAYSENGTKLLDVSKYVESCSTSVNGANNTFSISLQAVDDKATEMGDEMINRINIDSNNTNRSVWDFVQPSTFISERLPIPWFKKILQQNDIVFIRFERLTLEKTEDRIVGTGIDVSAGNLPGKVFDMIGLIDQVNSRLNPNTTDMSVDITGTDLTKVLIEDGSYFFPVLFTENSETLFFNTQDDSKWFKRSFVKNTFDYHLLYQNMAIEETLGFIVNQLANLGVCNDALFSSYGNRRTEVLQLSGQRKDTAKWNTVSGIWQIIDMLVDPQIADRRVANSMITNPSGNLMSLVEAVCQRPFVEFFGDTYGDKFTFIARTPPFTKNAILSVLESGDYIDVNLRDIEECDLRWDSSFYTWFEMDRINMTFGKGDSVSLAYLPIVYFPEIAESFGNKQLKITDHYISNEAFTGSTLSENRDLFKQKSVEDFLYIIECFCYLPFTEIGTISLKRDRRIKAKTWVKVGAQFFYVEAVSNSFSAIGEQINGRTDLTVNRGMYIDYIKGKNVDALNKVIDYWSPVKLDVIRKTLIQKLEVFNSKEDAQAAGLDSMLKATVSKNTVKVSFGTDKDAFDFFLQRKFL